MFMALASMWICPEFKPGSPGRPAASPAPKANSPGPVRRLPSESMRGPLVPAPKGHYRQIVDRFDRIARANLDASTVSDLRAAVGVSQRTLARAFRAVHGSTPVRYL